MERGSAVTDDTQFTDMLIDLRDLIARGLPDDEIARRLELDDPELVTDWRADGRSNRINVERHSLATRDLDEARRLLHQLDLTMAVRHGQADPDAIKTDAGRDLSLADGRRLYEAHVARAKLVGGTRSSSQKRYRAVFDKFVEYVAGKGLTTWKQVKARTWRATSRT